MIGVNKILHLQESKILNDSIKNCTEDKYFTKTGASKNIRILWKKFSLFC